MNKSMVIGMNMFFVGVVGSMLSTIFPNYSFPPWMNPASLSLLLIGFIIIILSGTGVIKAMSGKNTKEVNK